MEINPQPSFKVIKMDSKEKNRQKKHVTVRIVVCLLILLVGWAGMNGLASLKQPPAEAKAKSGPSRCRPQRPGQRTIRWSSPGTAKPKALTVVTIAPEVSGRLVYTHPMLKAGQIIPVGEVMFRIDPADYEAGLREAEAGVSQWQEYGRPFEKTVFH
jgi:multidrug efflux pump subunit AcrA (membrane-fusion protein)